MSDKLSGGKSGELSFHYIKAPDHHEIKVDGAIGGPSPFGNNIVVSVYSERAPIPRTVVYEAVDLGNERQEVGQELVDRREGRDGVVRVVQATLHMDLAKAKVFNKWLGNHIKEVEKRESGK